MKFIEPSKEKEKLKFHLDSGEYHKVGIFWGHGIGDTLMFQVILKKLKEMYPDIEFKMILINGLQEEVIYPDAVLVNSREEAQKLQNFDLICQTNFPLETDPNLTKPELCCKQEMGIEPVDGHQELPKFSSPLVAVHFCLTSLPDLANPTEEVAHKIWDEIHEVGLVPIEVHYHHVFDNPVNKVFPFIDCTVRGCQAKLPSLFGLLEVSRFFIGVVSGPFHSAMSILPHDRICYLEKDIPVARFTHKDIKSINIKNYKDGSIKQWLEEQIKKDL